MILPYLKDGLNLNRSRNIIIEIYLYLTLGSNKGYIRSMIREAVAMPIIDNNVTPIIKL